MTATATPAHLRAAAISTFLVFGTNGLVFASWAARIPAVTETLNLTPGQMGALLFCIAGGSIVGLPAAGFIASRIGTAHTVRLAGVISALAAVGVAVSLLAVSVPGTAVSLFFFGVGIGLWDVAQNIEGADVEQKLGRTIMPQLHAAFSGGALVGALVGAGLSTIGVGLPAHLLAIALLVAIAMILLPRHFLARVPEAQPAPDDAPRPKTRSAWTDRRTLLIGVVVLGATVTEGSGNDWIAKAAVDGLDLSESNGALIFAVFILAMTIMRFLGGRAIDVFGRVPVLRGSMVAAAMGLTLFVFAPTLWIALPGVALWGIGAALAFPIGMSAAADDPQHAAARVAVVSTLGYIAFLVGPPLLGFLGDINGIRVALLAIIIPVIGALLLSGAAKPLPKK